LAGLYVYATIASRFDVAAEFVRAHGHICIHPIVATTSPPIRIRFTRAE